MPCHVLKVMKQQNMERKKKKEKEKETCQILWDPSTLQSERTDEFLPARHPARYDQRGNMREARVRTSYPHLREPVGFGRTRCTLQGCLRSLSLFWDQELFRVVTSRPNKICLIHT